MKKVLFLSALLIGSLIQSSEVDPEVVALFEKLKAGMQEPKVSERFGAPFSYYSLPSSTVQIPGSMLSDADYQRLQAQYDRIVRVGGTPVLKRNPSNGFYYYDNPSFPATTQQPKSAADIFAGKSEEQIVQDVLRSEQWLKYYAADRAFEMAQRQEAAERQAENKRIKDAWRAQKQVEKATRRLQQPQVVTRSAQPVTEIVPVTLSQDQLDSILSFIFSQHD